MKEEFKVFFTASFSGRQKYLESYKGVLRALEKHSDVKIYTPEGGSDETLRLTNGVNYLEVLNRKRKNKIKDLKDLPNNTTHNKFAHYDAIRMCIMIADAVIIDGTHSSFRLGHEATIAVQHKKPTLILAQNRDYSDLINTSYLYGAKYTKYNVQEKIDAFLKEARKKSLRHRFNLMISDEDKEYIEQKAIFEDVSMAEYLRRLIEKDKN